MVAPGVSAQPASTVKWAKVFFAHMGVELGEKPVEFSAIETNPPG
jgi:hypothetical protein